MLSLAAPKSAHADGAYHSARLAHLTVAAVVDAAALEAGLGLLAPRARSADAEFVLSDSVVFYGTPVVSLLGRGLYLDRPDLDTTGCPSNAVFLKLRPSFGRRGASLQATFTF